MKKKIILIFTLFLFIIIFSLTAISQKTSPSLPDLTISSDDIEVSLEGEEMTITATVKNIGNADARDIDVEVKVGNILFDEKIKEIKAKEEEEIEVGPIVIGKTIPEGLKVIITVDPDNEIKESNEGNNVAEKSMMEVVEKEEIEIEPEEELPTQKQTTSQIATQSTTYYEVGEGAPNEEIKQAFLDCYNADPDRDRLGEPTTPVKKVTKGYIQEFSTNGIIMLKDGTEKAFLVKFGIYKKYLAKKRTKGPLGWPKTNELDAAPSGVSQQSGKYQQFDKGQIHWISGASESFETHGAIDSEYVWGQQGSGGKLGFPISDEYDWLGFKRSNFEDGIILWDYSKTIVTRKEELNKFKPNSKVVKIKYKDYYLKGKEKFNVVIEIKNTGNTPWTPKYYKFCYLSGDMKRGCINVEKDIIIKPQEKWQKEFKLKAPDKGGKYTTIWQMKDSEGKFFGEKCKISVMVTILNVKYLPQCPPCPSGNRNCGPACLAMGAGYLKNFTPTSNDVKKINKKIPGVDENCPECQTCDELNCGKCPYTTCDDLKSASSKVFEINTSCASFSTTTQIENEILKNRPVLVPVDCSKLVKKCCSCSFSGVYTGKHWLLVFGYDKEYFYCHDPACFKHPDCSGVESCCGWSDTNCKNAKHKKENFKNASQNVILIF